MAEQIKKIWILCELKKIGTLRQCEALAFAIMRRKAGLGERFTINTYDMRLQSFWSYIPPLLGYLIPFKTQLPNDTPDLIIAAGRKALPYALWCTRKTKVVFLQTPKLCPDYLKKQFHKIIAPQHDQLLNTPNTIKTKGVLNKIKPSLLEKHKINFRSENYNESHKTLFVVLGGNSKHYKYQDQDITNILAKISAYSRQYEGKVNILISPSRRTNKSLLQIIQAACGKNTFIWDGSGENPYLDFLALADDIFVTSDSMSMMSECCSSGKNVYIYKVDIQNKKFIFMENYLIENGYAALLNAYESFHFQQSAVLADLDDVVDKLQF